MLMSIPSIVCAKEFGIYPVDEISKTLGIVFDRTVNLRGTDALE